MMTPENEKEIQDCLQRVADRLMQVGYVKQSGFNSRLGKGALEWTEEGASFRDSIQKFFDMPNVSPQEISPIYAVSFLIFINTLKPI